jgi:phytoene dehydrogenase-like protein
LNVLSTCRDWTADTFEGLSEVFAPRVLHTGLGPDAAASVFMAQVIGVAIELGGMPVPRGGGIRLTDALAGIIRDAGGACETGREAFRPTAGYRANTPAPSAAAGRGR